MSQPRKDCVDSNVLHEISQLQFHPSIPYPVHTKKRAKAKGIAGHHTKEKKRRRTYRRTINPNPDLLISKISNLPFLNASDTATGAE